MPQHTGYACPECDADHATNPLMTRDGQYGYQCSHGHILEVDTDALVAMNLPKIAVPKAVQKPREGLVQFPLAIPGKLLAALRTKFGTKLESSVESVLMALLDSSSFIMTGFDVDKLGNAEFLGQKIKGPDQLIGLVYALRHERNEAVGELELFKANNKGSSPNGTGVAVNGVEGDFVQMQLRLSLDDFTVLQGKAKFNGKAPAQYLSEVLSTALTEGWL
jgi:hypothetical protein